MSNQEVTDSSFRFLQAPSESQNRSRPGGTERPGKTDDKGICFKHLDTPIFYGLSNFRLLKKVFLAVLQVLRW